MTVHGRTDCQTFAVSRAFSISQIAEPEALNMSIIVRVDVVIFIQLCLSITGQWDLEYSAIDIGIA